MTYCLFVAVFSFYMIYKVAPTHGNSNPLVYISICSLVGSISVMAVKGLGVAIKVTLSGNNQLWRPGTWVFAFTVAFAIAVQMNFFNKVSWSGRHRQSSAHGASTRCRRLTFFRQRESLDWHSRSLLTESAAQCRQSELLCRILDVNPHRVHHSVPRIEHVWRIQHPLTAVWTLRHLHGRVPSRELPRYACLRPITDTSASSCRIFRGQIMRMVTATHDMPCLIRACTARESQCPIVCRWLQMERKAHDAAQHCIEVEEQSLVAWSRFSTIVASITFSCNISTTTMMTIAAFEATEASGIIMMRGTRRRIDGGGVEKGVEDRSPARTVARYGLEATGDRKRLGRQSACREQRWAFRMHSSWRMGGGRCIGAADGGQPNAVTRCHSLKTTAAIYQQTALRQDIPYDNRK